jgi:uncharacterized protein YcfJ
MRITSVFFALLLMLSSQTVAAQDPSSGSATTDLQTATSDAAADSEERVEELRAELKALLEQSREGAEGVVRQFQSSTGITDSQVYGIAAGIVIGALAADLLGGGGLATIALAAGGGAAGNWIMSD